MLLSLKPRLRLAAIIAASMTAGGILTDAALAAQTHMLAARSDLQRADAELQSAKADKGGYRLQAISLTEQAIAAVNNGLQVGAE